jgi:hypothetical protein
MYPLPTAPAPLRYRLVFIFQTPIEPGATRYEALAERENNGDRIKIPPPPDAPYLKLAPPGKLTPL